MCSACMCPAGGFLFTIMSSPATIRNHVFFGACLPDEGQMSHVASLDSLNGRCTSSDLSKDPVSPTATNIPSTPSVGPEGQQSGPGPNVVLRSSSDTTKEPGVEEELVESPLSNGCVARYRTGNVKVVKTLLYLQK